MKPVLGLCIPTNKPDVAFSKLLSESSLENIVDLKGVVKLLFNLQSPWDDESVNELKSRLDSYDIDYDYTFNSYEVKARGYVPINKMREDAAKIDDTLLAYGLADDDLAFLGPSPKMKHSGSRQYLNMVHYLLTNEKCGLVLLGSSMFRKIPAYQVGPVSLMNTYVTGRGILAKKILDGKEGLLIPEGAYELLGSDEEKVLSGFRLAKGYYPAKTGNGRIRHVEFSNRGEVVSGSKNYGWNADHIRENNNFKFVRDNYNPNYVHRDGIAHNVCTEDNYINAGGIPITEEFVKSNTINYEDLTTDEVVKDLYDYLGSEY